MDESTVNGIFLHARMYAVVMVMKMFINGGGGILFQPR